MIRADAATKVVTTALLTLATAFAQPLDRIARDRRGQDRGRIARRSSIHHQGRDSARLAIGAWR
jgi:hypothetical protein